jgi:Tfp pilus assembly protein PilN
MKKSLLLIILFAVGLCVHAQVTVEAAIDSIEMLMGEQVHVTVTATMKEGAKAEFPVFKPTQQLIPGVEVLKSTEQGVKGKENGYVERQVVYTLTSFDDTLYYLPPFVVKVDGKAYKSKSLALKVIGIEVDTTHVEKFFGPKDVQENPFLWSDWSLLFWLSVLMLVLLAVCYYLYVRLRSGKPVISRIRIIKRLLPHQKAMKEIEQIKADKIQNAEDPKEYYTRLTDTLRKYIEDRYGFNAMEMTSSEIIERLERALSDDAQSADTMKAELRQLFTTADLVKFAKYSTMINENDANLVSAIDFINQTKLENMPTEEVVKPELTEADQRTVKTRRVLKVVVASILTVCALLLGYICYGLYQLLN